jgi:hypothetical protein
MNPQPKAGSKRKKLNSAEAGLSTEAERSRGNDSPSTAPARHARSFRSKQTDWPPGKDPGLVTVHAAERTFTFLLRDVNAASPILIPEFGAAVTTTEDARGYGEILDENRGRGLKKRLEQFADEPEETFSAAARESRSVTCQTWLGLSRDVRIFEVGIREPMVYTDWIQPRFAGHGYFWDEPEHMLPRFGFVAGRGWASSEKVKRRIDGGVLPILLMERIDDDVRYDHTIFVTLEHKPLSAKTLRGTHFRVADGFCVCKQLTGEEQRLFDELKDGELETGEETVLCCRIVATNTDPVPRYAYFKAVHPLAKYGNPEPHNFDGDHGFGSRDGEEKIFGVSRLNGGPLVQPEISILLQPGETATYEFFLPHSAVSRDRAAALADLDVDKHLSACRRFWKAKLKAAAQIHIPEKKINDIARAGLLHIDLVTYGNEPDHPLAPANGTYSPVISEQAVAVMYFDTMGRHDLARRCIDYYLARVQENGFLQTFVGYMLETGCLLWLIGEHFRYTRDKEWVKRIRGGIDKSCGFIERMREQNQQDPSLGGGYGLLDGKVADPENDEIIFMLNGYAYLGMSRAAECIAAIDVVRGRELFEFAESLKRDIRAAYTAKQGQGPVVPLGDGTWCPTVAPWLSRQGPSSLFTDDQCWWTHGAMTLRDDILGPLTLVYQEILEPHEQATDFLLDSQCELMRSRNAAFSQPYLARHQHAHLLRDEPEAFIKSYYNSLLPLVDRETYTFWEHFYHESPHKIGDEVQFSMQTRCMLYMEQGDTLHLLRGIPRAWMADGKRIVVSGAATYFGPLFFLVRSSVKDGTIEAEVECEADHKPATLTLRLPHPDKKKATQVEGGTYDAVHERMTFTGFSGRAIIRAQF